MSASFIIRARRPRPEELHAITDAASAAIRCMSSKSACSCGRCGAREPELPTRLIAQRHEGLQDVIRPFTIRRGSPGKSARRSRRALGLPFVVPFGGGQFLRLQYPPRQRIVDHGPLRTGNQSRVNRAYIARGHHQLRLVALPDVRTIPRSRHCGSRPHNLADL